MDHLNRTHAPVGDALWKTLDAAAVDAARAVLTARRFLEVEGPFGVGLTSIESGGDCPSPMGEGSAVEISTAAALPVPMLRRSFGLSVRRLAAAGSDDRPFDLSPVADAAEELAAAEEALLYQGHAPSGLAGLLTAPGRATVKGGDWKDPERALADVLAAVGQLGEAGFRGPYALALSPARYNSLHRLYNGTDLPQLSHFGKICARGVYKAPIEGGVVVDPRAATLVIGQDLAVGYAGTDGARHTLFVAESLVLRLDDPGAVCVIG